MKRCPHVGIFLSPQVARRPVTDITCDQRATEVHGVLRPTTVWCSLSMPRACKSSRSFFHSVKIFHAIVHPEQKYKKNSAWLSPHHLQFENLQHYKIRNGFFSWSGSSSLCDESSPARDDDRGVAYNQEQALLYATPCTPTKTFPNACNLSTCFASSTLSPSLLPPLPFSP